MTIEKINDNYMDTQGNIYVDAYTSEGKCVEVMIASAGKLIGATIKPTVNDTDVYYVED